MTKQEIIEFYESLRQCNRLDIVKKLRIKRTQLKRDNKDIFKDELFVVLKIKEHELLSSQHWDKKLNYVIENHKWNKQKKIILEENELFGNQAKLIDEVVANRKGIIYPQAGIGKSLSIPQGEAFIKVPVSKLDDVKEHKRCDCGAKYTAFPNHHLSYCTAKEW